VKPCAWCAEEIQDAALICRYCNRDQRTLDAATTQPSQTVGTMATTNTNAIIALVCALVVPFVGGIVGLVLGSTARREIRESRGAQSGDGLAVVAMILGGLQVFFFAMMFLAFCTQFTALQ
jgi:hypothetical protein